MLVERIFMKRLLIGLNILLALFSGWAFALPYFTIVQIYRAVVNTDAIALNQLIDFPALRQNINGTLKAENALGGSLTEPVINSFLTPEGFVKAIQEINDSNVTCDSNCGEIIENILQNTTLGPKGIGRFHATIHDPTNGNAIDFVFLPRGLNWQLSAITLPESAFQ
jgi:Protein of unknown function (DUF2939)